MAKQQVYDASAIQALKGLEPVRRMPGMYTHTIHPLHIVQEAIDNAVDEALAGFGKKITVTLRKDGRFFMTGYRRGEKVRCGKDRTGYKLYARSAIQCARKGYGYQQILRTYYGPRLDLVGGGGQSSSRVTNVYAADTTRAADATRVVDSGRVTDSGRADDPTRSAEPTPVAVAPTTVSDPQIAEVSHFGGASGGIGAILDRRGTAVL